MWTQEQYRELSSKISDKYNLTDWLGGFHHDGQWLHNDWHTIMELCVKHDITLEYYDIVAYALSPAGEPTGEAFYCNHNDNKSLTERVARMLALLEVNND